MTGVSLDTWPSIAEIIGAGSIITGLIVGLFQIRQFRVQQRDAVAINLAQTFYSPDLAGGIVSTMSRKLAQWQQDLRQEQQQPSWGEWFEWLGDKAREIKDAEPPGHLRFKS